MKTYSGAIAEGVFYPMVDRITVGNCVLSADEVRKILGINSSANNSADKNNQNAKADAGKPRISLVPTQIVRDIARIREYGNKKYGSSDNWKEVSVERYRDSLGRHVLSYLEDPHGRDEESGMPHLWHIACNVAFLCEMEKGEYDEG